MTKLLPTDESIGKNINPQLVLMGLVYTLSTKQY